MKNFNIIIMITLLLTTISTTTKHLGTAKSIQPVPVTPAAPQKPLPAISPQKQAPSLNQEKIQVKCDSKRKKKMIRTRITIVKGDITQQKVDAIVNAANEDLNHGGGVAAAIAKAAGPELQAYSNKMPIVAQGKKCPTGRAVITPAFNLKSKGIKNIIHAVGPRGDNPQKEQLLHDAYQNSLQVAKDNGLRSIAFPSISTAIFGYDINEATPVAFEAVRDFIKEHPNSFDEIRFVVFSDNDFNVYKKYESLLGQ